VIWGGLHGLYLCINHAWRAALARFGLKAFFGRSVFQPAFIALTFTAWSVALVVFRAVNMPTAWSIISGGFIDASTGPPLLLQDALSEGLMRQVSLASGWQSVGYGEIGLLMAVAAGICWALPNTQELLIDHDPVVIADNAPLAPRRLRWQPSPRFAVFTALLLGLSVLSLSSISRFIYFQF
jgi:hypothetical protein